MVNFVVMQVASFCFQQIIEDHHELVACSLGWMPQQARIFVDGVRFVSDALGMHGNCCNARKVVRKPSQCEV
jgi:hypothetical protein